MDNELVLSAPILLTLKKEDRVRNSSWRASIKYSRNCRTQRQSWNVTKSHNLSPENSFPQLCHSLIFSLISSILIHPTSQQLLIKEDKTRKPAIQKWNYMNKKELSHDNTSTGQKGLQESNGYYSLSVLLTGVFSYSSLEELI